MTRSTYAYWLALFVPATLRSQANALAQQLTGRAADDGTFHVGLSASGSPSDPIAWYWSCPHCEATAAEAIMQVYAAELPGSAWYQVDAFTGQLLATSSATARAKIGQPWTPDLALSDMGLKRIAAALP